jgi:LPXTG-site transpeptidase (sortase) family protein
MQHRSAGAVRRIVALLACLLAVAGCAGPAQPGVPDQSAAADPGAPAEPSAPETDAGAGEDGTQAAEQASASAPVPPPDAETQQAPADVPPQDPAELYVPSIDVRTPLIRLGLNPDRTLEVPKNFSLAGWYTKAPRPGEVGPAVIAGHVDSVRGPAVFARLHEMQQGDPIHVRRGDGKVVTFVVDRVERHPKDDFPTEKVYSDTDGPEVRLITCGGDFDRSRRSYRDNIIVYAKIAQA